MRYPLSFFDRPHVVAAKVMYLIHAGQLDRAQQEIAHARSRGYSFDSELSIVEQRVAEEMASLQWTIGSLKCSHDMIEIYDGDNA